MPSDIRHIVFLPSELLAAVSRFRARSGRPLPQGATVRAAAPGVRVEVVAGAGPADMVLEGDEVAAALILYCIDYGIPLPQESSKFVQRFGSQIGLVVRTEVPVPPGQIRARGTPA